jgi:hypothetical protein
MKKSLLSITLAFFLALTLTGCGGSKSADAPTESNQELVEEPTVEVQASGGFDNAITTSDGNAFTLSSPSIFAPGKFASGQVPGQSFNKFAVTVKNNGSSALELYALIVKGTTSGGECVDIFDGDNKIDGAPQEPLAAGKSLTFNWALSCPGKSGEDLSVVLLNGETALIEAKGKLA